MATSSTSLACTSSTLTPKAAWMRAPMSGICSTCAPCAESVPSPSASRSSASIFFASSFFGSCLLMVSSLVVMAR